MAPVACMLRNVLPSLERYNRSATFSRLEPVVEDEFDQFTAHHLDGPAPTVCDVLSLYSWVVDAGPRMDSGVFHLLARLFPPIGSLDPDILPRIWLPVVAPAPAPTLAAFPAPALDVTGSLCCPSFSPFNAPSVVAVSTYGKKQQADVRQ